MSRRTLRLFALFGALPIAAWAAPYQYTAQTSASAARRQGTVTAAGIKWNCAGNRCTTAGPWASPGVAACSALAKQVGPIKSYGHPQKRLGAAELAQCNAGVAPAAAVSQARPSAAATPSGVQKPVLAAGASPVRKPADTSAAARETTGESKPADAQKQAAAQKPAEATPAARTGPATFTTGALALTGTGALAARGPFAPKTFTSESLAATGTGALAARGTFTPVTFTGEGLTATGTGALR
jgi:hypothetical protein